MPHLQRHRLKTPCNICKIISSFEKAIKDDIFLFSIALNCRFN